MAYLPSQTWYLLQKIGRRKSVLDTHNVWRSHWQGIYACIDFYENMTHKSPPSLPPPPQKNVHSKSLFVSPCKKKLVESRPRRAFLTLVLSYVWCHGNRNIWEVICCLWYIFINKYNTPKTLFLRPEKQRKHVDLKKLWMPGNSCYLIPVSRM